MSESPVLVENVQQELHEDHEVKDNNDEKDDEVSSPDKEKKDVTEAIFADDKIDDIHSHYNVGKQEEEEKNSRKSQEWTDKEENTGVNIKESNTDGQKNKHCPYFKKDKNTILIFLLKVLRAIFYS